MAGRMNRFGCVVADVLNIFKTGSYAPVSTDFGGDTAVEGFIDTCCDEVIQNMPEAMFLSLSLVELELIETRATAGQSTATMTLKPVLAGKTHVWAGQPRRFRSKPRLDTDLDIADIFANPDLCPANELPSTAFFVDNATGVITFNPALNVNDQVFATYEPTASSLSVASLAKLVADGAAFYIGSKHYARGTAQWQFVDMLQERYTEKVAALRRGEWLPPEVRLMKFWEERIPEADKNVSMQFGRIQRG